MHTAPMHAAPMHAAPELAEPKIASRSGRVSGVDPIADPVADPGSGLTAALAPARVDLHHRPASGGRTLNSESGRGSMPPRERSLAIALAFCLGDLLLIGAAALASNSLTILSDFLKELGDT